MRPSVPSRAAGEEDTQLAEATHPLPPGAERGAAYQSMWTLVTGCRPTAEMRRTRQAQRPERDPFVTWPQTCLGHPRLCSACWARPRGQKCKRTAFNCCCHSGDTLIDYRRILAPSAGSQMVSCQPTEAGWSSLPEHLAASIVQLAFADTDKTPSQWLRWALICRQDHRSHVCLRRCLAHVHAPTSEIETTRRAPQ